VTLILTEEITGAEVSRLLTGNNDGLFAFSTAVDFSSVSGAANGSPFSSLALNDLFTGGSAGSGEDVTLGNGIVSFEGTEDFTGNDTDGETGVGGTMTSATTFELALATLTFQAGDIDSTTTLQLQEHVSADANPFLFGDGFAASSVGFGSSTIFVEAVPEPSSAAILALIGCTGLVTRRRK